MILETIGYAFLGGLLPSLLWLYFWLREDARCPEPRGLIWMTFLAGMVGVPLVLRPEQLALAAFASPVAVVFAWAALEEVVKYAIAALVVLWRKAVNESLDYVIYMITTALGFAALENALFLFNPLLHGSLTTGFVTENMRFMGATLLHVIASGTIGFAMAFSYKKTRLVRTAYSAVGLILAIALHAAFNLLIMQANGEFTLTAFFLVWTGAVAAFALFEVLKYFQYRRLPKNVC
ncbi:MAG: PrsW family intramembrane metalloprotease [Patescibacteria group bacterium]|nr:PrsW family intramembrane metalloprotease [Patescibacteria group bacterium]